MKKRTLKEELRFAFEPLVQKNIMYIIGLVLIVVYILIKNSIIGIFAALSILSGVLLEFIVGITKHGLKQEVRENLIALAIAIGVFAFFSFVLDSSSPFNVVVSCSMLPHLNRGDFLVLKGQEIYNAPELEVDKQDLLALYSPDTKLFNKQNQSLLSYKGSIFIKCLDVTAKQICQEFNQSPSDFYEARGNFRFVYTKCEKKYISKKGSFTTICLDHIEYKNKSIYENLSNDIISYRPKPTDLYASVGDIMHRVFVRLKTKDGEIAYLTKGDNNQMLDISGFMPLMAKTNTPISPEQIKGKVIFTVPYVGYVKLLVFGFVSEPKGCNSYFSKYD